MYPKELWGIWKPVGISDALNIFALRDNRITNSNLTGRHDYLSLIKTSNKEKNVQFYSIV